MDCDGRKLGTIVRCGRLAKSSTDYETSLRFVRDATQGAGKRRTDSRPQPLGMALTQRAFAAPCRRNHAASKLNQLAQELSAVSRALSGINEQAARVSQYFERILHAGIGSIDMMLIPPA